MTKRVFQEHGLQAACSLGLTLDADVSSDSEEVRVSQLHRLTQSTVVVCYSSWELPQCAASNPAH